MRRLSWSERILTWAVIGTGVSGLYAIAAGQNLTLPNPVTCEDLTLARPQQGVAYRGIVRNSDYRFTATIPDGTTGWGAGTSAPFHGFAIYLGEATPPRTCIVFTIGIQVDLPGDPPKSSNSSILARSIKVGNLNGRELRITGSIGGVDFENLIVSAARRRGGDTDDLTITLVTPTANRESAERVFATFLAGLKFW